MKKRILAVLFCLGVSLCGRAQRIVEDNFQRLEISFSVPDPEQRELKTEGESFTELTVPGMQPSAQVGAPNLPTWSALIEVPACEGYEVVVSGAVYDTVRLSRPGRVAPVQPSLCKSDRERHPLVIDKDIYASDAFFSAAPVATVEPLGVARDRHLARLQFSPVSYNPVRGELVVCRQATVTVLYEGSDGEASMDLFNRYYSPMFGTDRGVFNNLYPKAVRTSAPVRYLIVAHSMFRGQLDGFVDWKRRKGFVTDIVYTDDPAVGTTSTGIAAYVKSQYTNASDALPAPTYLLLVGDNEQIPAFSAQVTSPSSDHITDLYYATWTSGDHLPDCHYGRFSAQTVAQLTPQVEKTLMYEQYAFADPAFLDRAVMVAGVDGGTAGDNGYKYGDPAMDYAVTHYVNGTQGFSQVRYFKNDVTIVPGASNVTVGSSSASNAATVRSYYNQGAGWINYSAHGSATSWGTPSFTTSDAAAMTNSQKFGVMIGNCCLTNRFQVETCLGESLLRKGNYCGAVGYIGGSNSTYWGEDFYWAVGVRSGIGPTMSLAYDSGHLGNYDRTFNTHGESYGDWATTQGALLMFGDMAVESSTSSSNYKHYYWEIYHLMGDPSLMPYLTQAQQMTLTAGGVLMVGATSLSVTAAPYAYVALTDTLTHTIQACGYADAEGAVTLSFPSGLTVGGYELTASAQQYRTAFQTISVVPSSGPYPVVVSVTPAAGVVAGGTVPLTVKVANLGGSVATGVGVTLSADSPWVTLSAGTVSVGILASGDTVTRTVTATVLPETPDGTRVQIATATQWTGHTSDNNFGATLTVNAPRVGMTVTPSASHMLPGGDITLSVELTNTGHAPLEASQISTATGNPLMTVGSGGWSLPGLAVGATASHQIELHAAATMDSDIYVPVYITLNSGSRTVAGDTLQIYIGESRTETFEGGRFQWQWTQGTAPWICTSNTSYEGMWSARSAASMSNNSSSEMSVGFTVTRADSVSFYYKVSSESDYDKFHCYLDDVEQVEASGERDWTRAAFAVSAGSHQLRFAYTKDVSQSEGSDCAWVDNVALPHGSQVSVTTGGDTPGGESFENISADFESGADDSRWTLVNGTLTNVWVIGTAASNGGSRGLYISCDEGQTNSYNNSARASSVFAYTTLWLDADLYDASFDWRCNGEGNYDFLRAALVPATMTLAASSSLPSGWSTTSLPAEAIALDGGQKLNLSSSWATKETQVQITQEGWYRLVFFWRNDNSQGNMPPAGIDNVSFVRHSESHDVTVRDTVVVTVYDTVEVTQVVTVHDTTYVTLTDTVTVTLNVPVYDTTHVTLMDTVTVTEHVPVYDTTYVTLIDTVTNTVFDTVSLFFHDTVTITDTIFIFDTVVVHDTVYVTEQGIDGVGELNLKIYPEAGQVVVEGSEGEPVTMYDVTGRVVGVKRDDYMPLRFDVPASGTYMIKVGNYPARKMVMIR